MTRTPKLVAVVLVGFECQRRIVDDQRSHILELPFDSLVIADPDPDRMPALKRADGTASARQSAKHPCQEQLPPHVPPPGR
jgi:hypothetical protein